MDLELNHGTRKSILLSAFMRAWGSPIDRMCIQKRDNCIEVYLFANPMGGVVNRFLTVGLSSCISDRTQSPLEKELLLVLPPDNGGATRERTFSFLLDVCVYCLRETVSCRIGLTIPPSQRAPAAWRARSFLFDEPRGEPEFLSRINCGEGAVEVVWLVPIHEDERRLIMSHGMDLFDKLEASSQWSLADPNRPSFIPEAHG